MRNQTINEKGIAVITGASSGLGALYADRLAKRGYDLKLVARRGARLAALAQQLNKEYGVSVESLVADLGNPSDLERVANSIEEDQRITMLINNAGTVSIAPLSQTSIEDSVAMIDVNITAVVRLTQAVVGRFKKENKGTIVNIGSVLGFRSLPNFAVYSGTKGFVINFTQALQQEFAEAKVRIQLVLPATTSTEIWAVGGVPLSTFDPSIVMTAENCVDAALFGLDSGELVTLPSVENFHLWNEFETAGQKLFTASGNRKPASRYEVSHEESIGSEHFK
jgi:short-subunit dehydrogenase